MLDLFLNIVFFFMGVSIGRTQAINKDITERTEHMQELINVAYAERDRVKQQLNSANIKLDMWQERYWNLFEQLEKEIDGSTSSNDGSSEGSQRSNQLQKD